MLNRFLAEFFKILVLFYARIHLILSSGPYGGYYTQNIIFHMAIVYYNEPVKARNL